MKLSVKSDYATRAVFGLALHNHKKSAVRVEDVADEQGIPANYLVQILIELKSKGIVKSVRGKEGGYMLAKAPGEITLGDILRAIYGQIFDTPALADSRCAPELRDAWKRMKTAMEETAESITFQQMLDASSDKEKMYYI